MIKTKLNTNMDIVKNYINEAKKIYPDLEINELNVNDIMLMNEESNNCKNCSSLKECTNSNKGCYTSYNNGEFSLKECDYKLDLNKCLKARSVIKTLYMPKNIANASLKYYDVNSESRNKIFNYVIDFINNYGKKNGLYIHSSFSKGKTYTLGAIANELGKNGIECLLIYFPDLVVDLKSSLNDSTRFSNLLNMLKTVDVLMLDDLGSENMSPWLRDDVLGPIINYRLMDNKPLFISSNIRPDKLKNHFMLNQNDTLKAERIRQRLSDLTISICMDDSQIYSRQK